VGLERPQVDRIGAIGVEDLSPSSEGEVPGRGPFEPGGAQRSFESYEEEALERAGSRRAHGPEGTAGRVLRALAARGSREYAPLVRGGFPRGARDPGTPAGMTLRRLLKETWIGWLLPILLVMGGLPAFVLLTDRGGPSSTASSDPERPEGRRSRAGGGGVLEPRMSPTAPLRPSSIDHRSPFPSFARAALDLKGRTETP
jgi:hypothetical protein